MDSRYNEGALIGATIKPHGVDSAAMGDLDISIDVGSQIEARGWSGTGGCESLTEKARIRFMNPVLTRNKDLFNEIPKPEAFNYSPLRISLPIREKPDAVPPAEPKKHRRHIGEYPHMGLILSYKVICDVPPLSRSSVWEKLRHSLSNPGLTQLLLAHRALPPLSQPFHAPRREIFALRPRGRAVSEYNRNRLVNGGQIIIEGSIEIEKDPLDLLSHGIYPLVELGLPQLGQRASPVDTCSYRYHNAPSGAHLSTC